MTKELLTRTFSINSLTAEPPGLDRLQETIHCATRAAVVADTDTSPDMLGGALDTTIYACPASIIVTGTEDQVSQIGSWPEIRDRVTPLATNELLDCIDWERLEEDYGVPPRENGHEAASLLAAMLATQTQENERTGSTAFLTPDKQNLHGHPLLWLSWAQQHGSSGTIPIATQIAEWGSQYEGLRYQSNTFLPQYGASSEEVWDVLGKKDWLPSSQLLVMNSSVAELPQATANDIGQLVTALGTAEIARHDQKSLHRLVLHGLWDQGVSFNPHDAATRRLAVAMESMQTQLYMSGYRLQHAPPEVYRKVNAFLAPNIGVSILPSAARMQAEGYINKAAVQHLNDKVKKRQWKGNEGAPMQASDAPRFKDGMIPDWDPAAFGSLLNDTYAYLNNIKELGPDAMKKLGQDIWKKNGENGRPHYAMIPPDKLPASFQEMFDLGIYNLPARNLWTDEMTDTRNEVLNFLRTGDVVAGFMFVNETDAVRRTATYAVNRIGRPKRVIAADQGKSPETTAAAEESGATIARFKENMRKINWKKLAQNGIIPSQILDEEGLPVGLKGLNVLNLMIELDSMEKEGEITDNTWVFLTDGADKNQGEVDDFPPEEWFDGYLHLGLAVVDGEKKELELHSVLAAKTGIGRNNYLTASAFDKMARSPNKKIAELGLALAPTIWPHAGTRAYRWKDLKRFHTEKDMQIEQMLDICAANIDVETRRRGTAQVIIEPGVADSGVSDPLREWSMMGNLALCVEEFTDACVDRDVLPLDMTMEDIKEVNRRIAGKSRFQSVIIDNHQDSRKPVITTSGGIIPSLSLLKQGGYMIH